MDEPCLHAPLSASAPTANTFDRGGHRACGPSTPPQYDCVDNAPNVHPWADDAAGTASCRVMHVFAQRANGQETLSLQAMLFGP